MSGRWYQTGSGWNVQSRFGTTQPTVYTDRKWKCLTSLNRFIREIEAEIDTDCSPYAVAAQ